MSTKTDFPPQDFASQVLGELNKDEQVVQAEKNKQADAQAKIKALEAQLENFDT